jgi:predicted alpha/beta hydrolase family esterase
LRSDNVVWHDDVFFGVEKAPRYTRDLPQVRIRILDRGHMVHETDFDEVPELVGYFL